MARPAYLDANVLIQAVEGPETGLLDKLERLQASGIRFLTSELCLAEVLAKPLQKRQASLVAIYEDMLAESGPIETVPIDRGILRKSAEVRAWLGGKLPDTIHIATAIVAGCEVILSSDKRLKMPHGIRQVPVNDIEALDRLL